jgi:hypothetical protein
MSSNLLLIFQRVLVAKNHEVWSLEGVELKYQYTLSHALCLRHFFISVMVM